MISSVSLRFEFQHAQFAIIKSLDKHSHIIHNMLVMIDKHMIHDKILIKIHNAASFALILYVKTFSPIHGKLLLNFSREYLFRM